MKKKIYLLSFLTLCLSLAACSLNFDNFDVSSENSSSVSEVDNSVPMTKLVFEEESVEIIKGQKGTVRVKGYLPRNATNPTWVLSSENESIATVTEDGVVTAKAVGKTNILATALDTSGLVSKCEVNVIAQQIDSAFKKRAATQTYSSINPGYNLPSKGNQKVLVLPIYFSDDSAKATEDNRQFIEYGFFGSNEDCLWRSFTSYMEEASYDQLHYSGYVSNWWNCGYTKQQILDDSDATIVRRIVAEALGHFKDTHSSFDWSGYDNNNDGYVDQISIIYSSDYVVDESGKTTNLWGFRWSTEFEDGKSGKQPLAFTWFSLKFMKDYRMYGGVPEGGNNTRIIIHEHSHMLGLSDYYDTSYAGKVDYVGSYDMQSNNVLDWNAFSKFAVGWTEPYYLDETIMKSQKTATITIGASALTGESIVVKGSSWIGSPFDEYLMIELLNTRAGNNAYDGLHSASGLGLGGIRIYHVDARLRSDGRSTKYGNSYRPNNPHLLQLIQRGNMDTFGDINGRDNCTESDLFKTGYTFTIGEHEGFADYGPSFFINSNKFNDGSLMKYGIRFDKVTTNSATITFTYFD